MNLKKLITATILSFIVMFAVGGLWYAGLMAEFYENNFATFGSLARPTTIFPQLIVEIIIVAFILAWIFPKISKGEYLLKGGLMMGAVVGLLIALPGYLAQMAVGTGVEWAGIIVDTLFRIVEQGVGGLVVAWIYRRNSK